MEHAPGDPIELGQRLRALRRTRGLNQQDLASDEISVSYVSLIETGKRTPSEAVLKALAERLGCSVEYLRTGQDDTRVRDLELKIAFADLALHNGSNGEALAAYSETLTSGGALSSALRRRAQVGQALAMEKLGRLEAAIELLTRLFEDPASVVGSASWTQLAVALCRCHRELGDHILSIQVGEQAMRHLDRLGLKSTDDHLQLGSTLVSCYHLRGDLGKAHQLARQLIARADETGSRVARGSVYWNAALVAQSRGLLDEALALMERARVLMAETDNQRHHALLKSAYGQLLLDAEPAQAEHARDLLLEAQETIIEVGTAAEQAKTEMYLAQCQLVLGCFQDALQHAGRATDLMADEPRWETARAGALLAVAQFGLDRDEEARQSLDGVARQLRQVGRSRQTATVWRLLGDIWNQHGHHAQAISAYQQACDDAGLPAAKVCQYLPSSQL